MAERVAPAHGQIAGYVVLTHSFGMGWQDDWDGRVHPTIEDGRAELRKASEAGQFCILTELRRVKGSG